MPVSELLKQGDEHSKQNHPDTAIGYYVIAARRYSPTLEKSDKLLCAIACNAVGLLYSQQENYFKAFEFYLKAIRICEENGFMEQLADAYKNIGNIYNVFGDYQQAINCYKKG